jgi:hypothetical protein
MNATHIQMQRGDGTTTRQMHDAPKGALYIWCNSQLHYPRDLAKELGRTDLVIDSPTALEWPGRHVGKKLTGIVLDHACVLTDDQHEGYQRLLAYVR